MRQKGKHACQLEEPRRSSPSLQHHRTTRWRLEASAGQEHFWFLASFMRMMWSPSSLRLSLTYNHLKGIMSLSEQASGLAANYAESHVYPINCSNEHISLVRSILTCPVSDFPCTYLCVPLSARRLPKTSCSRWSIRSQGGSHLGRGDC
jgi:hypothetical protein